MAPKELNALVLQGGGALGAYQAGAFSALDKARFSFDWVAGISIGAINAALICGNSQKDRIPALEAFWNRITTTRPALAPFWTLAGRHAVSEMAAAEVMMAGAPGFFRPRFPGTVWPLGPKPALSISPLPWSDTTHLRGHDGCTTHSASTPRLSLSRRSVKLPYGTWT